MFDRWIQVEVRCPDASTMTAYLEHQLETERVAPLGPHVARKFIKEHVLACGCFELPET